MVPENREKIEELEEYEEYEEPPIRKSKRRKPKMGVSGRSVFTIHREMKKRWRKKSD